MEPEPVAEVDAPLLEVQALIEQILEIAGERPVLFVCANARDDDPPGRHQALYFSLAPERRCPDCGRDSLVDFVVRKEGDDFADDLSEDVGGGWREGERPPDDVSRVLMNLGNILGNALFAANPIVLPVCPHTGRERVFRCQGGPHRHSYPGYSVGSSCPTCAHVNLV